MSIDFHNRDEGLLPEELKDESLPVAEEYNTDSTDDPENLSTDGMENKGTDDDGSTAILAVSNTHDSEAGERELRMEQAADSSDHREKRGADDDEHRDEHQHIDHVHPVETDSSRLPVEHRGLDDYGESSASAKRHATSTALTLSSALLIPLILTNIRLL